jgi:hypothetical protein
MSEGYRGSTEPIPPMKTVRPTSINDKGEVVTDGGLMVGKVIRPDAQSVQTIDGIIDELRDEIHTLKLQRKWQKEAIQRVNAVLNKWHTEAPALDPLHRNGMSALVFRMVDEMQAALVHDDSGKEEDGK